MAVLVLELVPPALFGFASDQTAKAIQRCPRLARIFLPAFCAVPYLAVSISEQMFRWQWAALYAGLPVAISFLSDRAAVADPEQRGNWRDAIILLVLGLAVDLRWFEGAWPSGLAASTEM